MNISYNVSIIQSLLFENAYSYLRLRVEHPTIPQPPALYAALPITIANDVHVQRVFERAPDSLQPPNAVFFDIFFPLLPSIQSLNITFYPNGTDPQTINDDTPGYNFKTGLSNLRQGSTLLLGFEDKEKNVRVLPIAKDATTLPYAIKYTWTATILPDATTRVPDAIAHITELHKTNFIKVNKFSANGSSIPAYFDPLASKYHIYFRSGTDGLAILEILQPTIPSWGHLIYWPFADNASETARIVFYDPFTFGPDLFGPIPENNPITLSDYTESSGPTFKIENKKTPPIINGFGKIYFLINDTYEKTIQSTNNSEIILSSSITNISGSFGKLPESNTSRYIYVNDIGDVLTSPKYSFFAFQGKKSPVIPQEINFIHQSPCFNT